MARDIEPFEGEWVWAELVDDETPGSDSRRTRTTTNPAPARRGEDAEGGRHRAEPSGRTVAQAAATILRAAGAQVVPGLRDLARGLHHWTTVAHMSDEEIRRHLVKRHLDLRDEQREEVRAEVTRLTKRTAKLTRDAVDWGLTAGEAARLKDAGVNLKLHSTAAKVLHKQQLDLAAIQPTPDQIRHHRTTRTLARAAGVVLPVGLTTIGLVLAAPLAGLVAIPILAGAAWWVGRHPLALGVRPIPAELCSTPELDPIPGADTPTSVPAGAEAPAEAEVDERPFPISKATTVAEATEAVRRALLAEDLDIEAVTDVEATPYGWSARVTFATGSPDVLHKEVHYGRLITALKLRRAGLLVEGDPDSGDTAILRMLLRDPFTPEVLGPLPYRAPRSTSILDPFDFGVAIDSVPFVFTLAGLMLLIVADSGAGKSGMLLALAEAVTSTRDAVLINLDPINTGVGELGPAITLNAFNQTTIGAVLEFLLELSSVRAHMRASYGWGNQWRPSPLHPALCVFVDEWPALSEENKEMLILLLLRGRKDGVWVFGGSQFGTKDALGKAIGPKLAGKLLGSCRGEDITGLLGKGAIAEGYRADLLEPATNAYIKRDAGQVYGTVAGLDRRPIRYKFREIDPVVAQRLGAERAAAGLPDLIPTLTEAGLSTRWSELVEFCARGGKKADPATASGEADGSGTRSARPSTLGRIRAAFEDLQDPAWLTLDALQEALREGDPETWSAWDDRSDQDRLREVGRTLARLLKKEKAELSSSKIHEIGGLRGYYLADVEAAIGNLPADPLD
ncbi:hypothetical protein ACN20G_36845 (plasmid) [Streptomyces sp. BI20]|uniref:hypothetical protein n=1 Tax=Streptomyces sp. BI20 TaxID=3403460 RepID=UPI003C78AEAE